MISFLIISFFTFLIFAINILGFKNILFSSNFPLHSNLKIFNFILEDFSLWNNFKKIYVIITFFSSVIIASFIYNKFFSKILNKPSKIQNLELDNNSINLLVGKSLSGIPIYIPEASLYQNMLITGGIGTGKTSSAMYPFTKQLLAYMSNDSSKKIGFLILDVKGNYYSKVLEFAQKYNRMDDLIVIELCGKYVYNPLDKPNLRASVLANRLKTILLLFSPNNSESYWLDKAEQVIENCITFCRIYNEGYVTFEELHKLVSDKSYYLEKTKQTRQIFLSGKLSNNDVYDLFSSISFLEKDFYSLDERTHNLLKSEITRITNPFVSSYDVLHTFCPAKNQINFYGFEETIKKGKIVVLNLNIGKYKNLSKIIAAYLKLDFQTDVISQLSDTVVRPMCFISDEYQEYVTTSDADFFAQSREAKCINIVSTQSYTSLLNTLNNQYAMKVIIQNLVNKLWFRTDDILTIEDAQKQLR